MGTNRNSSFVLAAPPMVRNKWDVFWYEINVTDELGTLTGKAFNSNGGVDSQFELTMRDETSLKAVFSQEECRITEVMHLTKGSITVSLNETEIEITGTDPGDSIKHDEEMCISSEEVSLVSKWENVGDQLRIIGPVIDDEVPAQKKDEDKDDDEEDNGENGDSGDNGRSCLGCTVQLGGTAILGACCGFSLGTNAGCCGGTLVSGGDFIDNCKGACAD